MIDFSKHLKAVAKGFGCVVLVAILSASAAALFAAAPMVVGIIIVVGFIGALSYGIGLMLSGYE